MQVKGRQPNTLNRIGSVKHSKYQSQAFSMLRLNTSGVSSKVKPLQPFVLKRINHKLIVTQKVTLFQVIFFSKKSMLIAYI
jgi:hypothetical protein